MAINVKDLPLKYQAQAVKKYMEQQARRGSMPSAGAAPESPKGAKYHNKPAERVTESGAVLHLTARKRRAGMTPCSCACRLDRFEISASRLISLYKRHTRTRRAAECGLSGIERILHIIGPRS